MHGHTHTSEDSSEVAFLLVENYNYDRSMWSSDRMGIFGHFNLTQSLPTATFLFIGDHPSWMASEKRDAPYHDHAAECAKERGSSRDAVHKMELHL